MGFFQDQELFDRLVSFSISRKLRCLNSIKFVAAELGSGYTVEEQVTGKAEIGGFQFDIFPRRPEVDGRFFWEGKEVDSTISSPSELGMVGGQLVLVLLGR